MDAQRLSTAAPVPTESVSQQGVAVRRTCRNVSESRKYEGRTVNEERTTVNRRPSAKNRYRTQPPIQRELLRHLQHLGADLLEVAGVGPMIQRRDDPLGDPAHL